VTNRVNGKELIEANVTSTKPIKINNLNKASMYDTFMYAKNFNNFRDEMYHSDVLMYRTDIFTLKKSTYYQYPIVQFRRSPFIEHFPMTNIHTVNYWSRIESLSKTAPEIKINEITDLIITDKTKIFYSKSDIDYPYFNKKIVKNFIPNNSTISIFGRLNINKKYVADYLGLKEEVISEIAYRYYHISDARTSIYFILLLLSFIFYYNKN
jgi:hypothetical protein